MYENVIVGNSEKLLVNSGVIEKLLWIKKSSQIFHNMMNMGNMVKYAAKFIEVQNKYGFSK